MVFSGEVHPFRNPVQSLHFDVLQKIKSMGFSAVSIYIHWGLLEPERGEISFEGFRDLQPFFDAAKKAGLYVIARPGPYINAETAGGGLPGWGTYTPGLWRTANASYVEAYQPYIKAVGEVIANNQITHGGPVILVQAENEYSGFWPPYTEDFEYEAQLLKDFRNAGIVVPITTNDAWPGGHFTSVDIYGYDSYPNGFDCAHPYVWSPDAVPEYFWGSHEQLNPEDPNAVYEFQGGGFDGWGGAGYEGCSVLTGPEFERVFYKNQYAMSTTIFNIYMTFGGTNWGGISHPGVYTSYDYGAAITESRVLREKYYETKLQANFLAVSPAYLTSKPQNIGSTQGSFTGNSALKTTQTLDVVGNKTGFYIVRQTDASSFAVQSYNLTLPTSVGALQIPVLGGSLTLSGKDSKIHVVDYAAGSTTLLYSTSEILTWATIDGQDIILLYGNQGELHETAFILPQTPGSSPFARVVSGTATIKQQVLPSGALAIQYTATDQTVVQIGPKLKVFILDRSTAYQYWVLHPPTVGSFASFGTENPIIVKGGYLLRTASVSDGNLAITGDLNDTATFEIIAPAASSRTVSFNSEKLNTKKTSYGTLTASRNAHLPDVDLPKLNSLTWRAADSLPEILPNYSDEKWTVADLETTFNEWNWTTPLILFSSPYGYHTGNILWRAHFTATGMETGFSANISGGLAFAYSMWLDDSFIGAWTGDAPSDTHNDTHNFPSPLVSGSSHIITILMDHMGIEQSWAGASDWFRMPRGVLGYSFVNSPDTNVTAWKLTGNLGGESYVDHVRGPLNEGGLYAERQGWHLPGFDDSKWALGKPTEGISNPGVAFYRTTFDLNIPHGVDYPLAFVFTNSTTNPHFRAKLYVNGYQFGRYINHIGPQKVFPVPQGILRYNGQNTLAVSLWATDAGGAKINSLNLELRQKVETSFGPIDNAPAPTWRQRPNAF
ncbi:glycoside hydrolase family 35 protein [Macrolepiota fuliginosa MF-IS2]|uniref:Beta-galactosidase n=1 Tax=Macrolepiota fuliginosa MF-IS2 TaxID=1400762 RepID=A0A9P6C890_9AGAR|nr:glycoside hydrolase family 35 protein [Macrolepiota fuliginosa MF-IS2]